MRRHDDRSHRAARNERGFTILELVTVTFVLAILAAVAMPAASSDTDRRLNMLQLQLQDALEYAQSIAYHTGARTAVKFGTIENNEEPWVAVINELGVPQLDPLTKTYYVVRFDREASRSTSTSTPPTSVAPAARSPDSTIEGS